VVAGAMALGLPRLVGSAAADGIDVAGQAVRSENSASVAALKYRRH
jgi:hypothetical protein